jgi:outer membrane protein OmpA-like peptidoglycan-associated protein
MSENFKNVELGKAQSSGTNGSYEFKVPIGANYAYYFKKQGYSGASDNAFLKDKKKEITITKDIVLKKPWDGSITVNNIFFEYNKSDLKPESFTELDRLVELLTEYPEAKVEISGHTDNIGNDIYNQTLSQDRAGSVVNYLIRKDMKKENLIAKGYGKTKPVADNSTDEGRAMNRRVEFKFLK